MMNKTKSVDLYRGVFGKDLVKKLPITAGALLFAATFIFTACPNNAGEVISMPKYAVNFKVDGGDGTIKAMVGGSEIHTGDLVEEDKIVEFIATPDDAVHDVDYWMISTGNFEAGSGVSGSTSAKVKVAKPLSVTVKFKSSGMPSTPMHTLSFGVSATGGMLKAEVDGIEITSPAQVAQNKTIDFTAEAALGYAVEKWTKGGTQITGQVTLYNHTVTADADIAVHFKIVPVDVYVSERGADGKLCVWKNNVSVPLTPFWNPSSWLNCYAVKARGNDVYIAGDEQKNSGSSYARVWKKDGSLYWFDNNRAGTIYDIAFHNGKTLVAGTMYDDIDNGAIIADISDPEHPVVGFLCNLPLSDYAEASSLYSTSGTVYAAGYKTIDSAESAFLWTLSDDGTISEVKLGAMKSGIGDPKPSFGICASGGSVYVAGEKLWKVTGATVSEISVSDGDIISAVCTHGTAVYAAGKTPDDKPAVWKIEGASVFPYNVSDNFGEVYALCAVRDELYAAGVLFESNRPAYWHIAGDAVVTEHILGTDEGGAYGICVTARE